MFRSDKGFMTPASFTKLQSILKKAASISFVSSGEPFTNKNALLFFEKIRKINKFCTLNLATNGMLLNEKKIRSLIDMNFSIISFSIDSVSQNKASVLRKNSDVKTILKNLNLVKTLRKKKKKRLPLLKVQVVLSKRNIRDIESTLKALQGVDQVLINNVIPYTPDSKNEIVTDDLNSLSKTYLKIRRIAKDLGLQILLPDIHKKIGKCHAEGPIILFNGDVVPCYCKSFDRKLYVGKKEKWLKKKSFGNINKLSFERIWFSQQYLDFRKRLNTNLEDEDCKSCIAKRDIYCP